MAGCQRIEKWDEVDGLGKMDDMDKRTRWTVEGIWGYLLRLLRKSSQGRENSIIL